MKTFNDTAAIVDQLDLIITVDTSLLHLAGAMGKGDMGIDTMELRLAVEIKGRVNCLVSQRKVI